MNARLNSKAAYPFPLRREGSGEGESLPHLSGRTLPLAPSRQGRGDAHWNPVHG